MFLNQKRIIIAAGFLSLGIGLFLFWQFFGHAYFNLKICVAGLRQSTNEDLINKSNILIGQDGNLADENTSLLIVNWSRYFTCRLNYDYFSDPRKLRDLVRKLDIDESTKNMIFENFNKIYEITPFRRNIIFAPLEYLCPVGKENPTEIGKCLDFPADRGEAEKFNRDEVAFACNNFCRDLIRYEQNHDLFFEEQEKVKTKAPYNMSNFLTGSWSIRFGGWDFALKEIEKYQDDQYRELVGSRLTEGRDSIAELAEKTEVECLKDFENIKELLCRFE